MKKGLIALLCVVLIASVFTGCQPKEQPSEKATAPVEKAKEGEKQEKEQEKVKIKVSIWDKSTSTTYDDLLVAFNEKYPHIEVEYMDISSTEYTNKLSIMLNGRSELDAFFIKDADTSLSLYEKGQLADLTEFIAKDGVDLSIYNGLADNFKFGDGVYGMPYRTDFYVLYYNKDIFDAAGEPYPSNDMTWEEYEAIAERITAGEGADKRYGAFTHTWNACVQNWSVQDGKNTIVAKDYSFMKSYYERALRMQNEAKSVMDYATLKTSNIHYSGPFYNEQVGMLPMGSWFMNGIINTKNKGETNVNWGVARLPHSKDIEAGYTVGATTPLAMNENSEKKEATWEFIKFVTSQEGGEIIAKKGTLPACLSGSILDIIASADGMPEGVAEALEVKNICLDRPIVPHVVEINKLLGEEHSLIMLGEESVDEGLEKIAQRVAEVLE